MIISFSIALAQDKTKINCDSAQTQTDMNMCAEINYKKADKELNTVYKDLMKKIRDNEDSTDAETFAHDKKYENAVIQAQKKWLEYRDSFAHIWELKYEGGSMGPMMYFGELTRLTRSQIKELQDLLNEEDY